MENPFAEKYATIENWELLKILEDAENYQPRAVEAARFELNSRTLTDEQLRQAKDDLQQSIAESHKSREKLQQAKSSALQLTKILQRDSYGNFSSEQYIGFLSIIFLGFFVLQTVAYRGLFAYYITDYSMLGFGDIPILFPFACLISGLILFWKRSKAGWILLVAYTVFSFVSLVISVGFSLLSLIEVFRTFPTDSYLDYIPASSRFAGSMLTGSLYLLSFFIFLKDRLRAIYNVTMTESFFVTGLSFIATMAMLLPFIL